MTSRIFVEELVAILDAELDVPVFAYDGNVVEKLPCVLVGIESEEVMEGAILDNFLLKAFIAVKTNGYDDAGNDTAESIKNAIIQILIDGHVISCLDGLFFLGGQREDGEDSTLIVLKFDAYTHTV